MFPFLGRELVTALRRPARFGLMAILVGLAWLVTVTVWWAVSWKQYEFQTDTLSRAIFIAMSYLQLLVGCAVGFWAAGSIAGEREHETWDLLATIPTRTVRMVFEKISGHIAAMVLLMASFIPFLGLCFLLGGVGPDEIVSGYAIIISFMLVSTCMGVMCSAWNREEAAALRWFAIGLFLYLVLLPIAYLLFAEMNGIRFVQPVVMSPVLTMILHHSGERFPYGPNWTGITWLDGVLTSPWKTHLLISVGMVFIFLRTAYIPFQKQKNRKQSVIKQPVPLTWNSIESPFRDDRNLITRRELLSAGRSRWGRPWIQFLWMTAFCVLFAVCMHGAFLNSRKMGWLMMVYSIFFIGSLLASTASSGSIAGERRHGTWDILCTTLLKPRTILEGKYSAAIRRTMTTIALLSIYLLAVGFAITPSKDRIARTDYDGPLLWAARPHLIPIGFLFAGSWVMYLAIGQYFSVTSKSPTVAQIKTFVAVVVHTIVPLLSIMLVAAIDDLLQLRLNLDRDYIIYVILSLTPLALIADVSKEFGAWTEAGAFAMFVHSVIVFLISAGMLRRASRILHSIAEGGTAP